MEYTEEIKKEADSIVSKIEIIYYGDDLSRRYKLFYQLAIQDRQSVLEELIEVKDRVDFTGYIENRTNPSY